MAFEADTLGYDNGDDTITASGDVVLRSGDQSVRADAVSWNRTSGQIVATGNVRLVDADGNQLFTDRVGADRGTAQPGRWTSCCWRCAQADGWRRSKGSAMPTAMSC